MSEKVKKNAEIAADVAENESNENKEVNMENDEKNTEGVKQGEEVAKSGEAPKVPATRESMSNAWRKAEAAGEFVQLTGDNLKSAAKMCAAVAAKNAAMPMFEFMQMKAGDETMTLRACNQESALSVSIPAYNAMGRVETRYVPCRKAAQIADSLDGDVFATFGEYEVGLAANKGRTLFRLNASTDMWADDDFGAYDIKDGKEILVIKADALLSSLKNVKDCMSKDETRKQLNAVCLHVFDGSFYETVATDGRTLAIFAGKGEGVAKGYADDTKKDGEDDGKSKEILAIISAGSVDELLKFLGGLGNMDVHITHGEAMLKFECKNLTYTTKLVAGNYPNYRQVIPGDEKFERLTINRKEFADAVRQSELFGTDFKMEIADNDVKTTVQGEDGEFNTELKGSGAESLNVSITFGLEYIKRPMSVLQGDEITLYLAATYQPMLVKEGGYLFMLMPMKG